MVLPKVKSEYGEHWFFGEVLREKGALAKTVYLNFFINILQIITSLFVMVVYNKVLPFEATASLLSLVIGIAIVLLIDALFKVVKTRIIGHANEVVERRLQEQLFRKVLSWDLQNRPKFSGAASSLMRDVESITELFTLIQSLHLWEYLLC